MGFSQVNLNVTGTVKDLQSHGIHNATIVIQNSDTIQNGLLYSQWFYSDSGNINATSALPSGITTGTVSVGIGSCSKWVSQDYNFGPGNYSINLGTVTMQCNDPAICSADFNYYQDTTINDTFTQYIFGSNSIGTNLSYLWDFGDGSTGTQGWESHVYDSFGYYDVKLVINNGTCSDSITKLVNITPRCYRSFTFTTPTNDLEVQFIPEYLNYDNYNWDFGDGNTSSQVSPKHKYASGGIYEVELSISDSTTNCSEQEGKSVYLCDHGGLGMPSYIGGQIYGSLDSIEPKVVYLIEYDSAAGTLTLVDSQVTSLNWYHFTVFCQAEFLVKAALLSNATHYQDYLPTYHDSFLFYHQASAVSPGTFQAHIWMIAGNNQGGPGFIGGYVSQGANKSGDGLEGISVLLLTDSDQPVRGVFTGAGGRYEFDNLALGKYKVQVEIPGKQSAVHHVELTQNKSSADENDFSVNEDNISLDAKPVYAIVKDLKVYPNPASDKLYFELNGTDNARIFVTDINGKKVLQQNISGNGTSELRVSELDNGLYLIQIIAGDKQHKGKFIIQR